MFLKFNSLFIFLIFSLNISAQQLIGSSVDEFNPALSRSYELGGVTVKGTQFLDNTVLVNLSGLVIGDNIEVPGEPITKAIRNLWEQNLFSDISISVDRIQNGTIFLQIDVTELPRLSRFSFSGLKKSDADDIREKIKLIKGKIVNENLIVTTRNKVMEHFVDKGFLNTSVVVEQKLDTTQANSVILYITVHKGKKVKIHDIQFEGNASIVSRKLRKAMKDTKRKKWYTFYNTSKYIAETYEKDKQHVIDKYNSKGFRDAKIVQDTVYKYSKNRLNIKLTIDEGKKYYFRNITWIGNSKHTTKELSSILGIKRGDVFDQSLLDQKLQMNQEGRDVSSLYMDDGYLFFQVTPVEILVENDSIDFEMRIYEGKQAIINKVTVIGNTKTNDRVIMREIRTKPGQLFSRADIIRSQRELAQLSYFDAEKLGVNPKPNPTDGTVDIEYIVEEKPSDQIELSGGWGNKTVVGTLGVSFNNFSTRNFLKKNTWRPLPAGDGQTLSIRAQSNGLQYQSYNLTFVEPWLGGKKPNSFSVSAYYSVLSNALKRSNPERRSLNIYNLSVGLGKRLQVPDDYFTFYNELNYQYYVLNNYNIGVFSVSNGFFNNFSYRANLSRNSIDAPIYPRKGSQISLSVQLTPPYSLLRKKDKDGNEIDYATADEQERYRFIEYHKWKFTASWFTPIDKDQKLVLNAKAGFGFLGMYNTSIGISPFERFYLGGSGLSGFSQFDGREIIALRGYEDGAVSPTNGASAIAKYTMELRYPVSLNPSATIYGLVFAEAGNSWGSIKKFNPFEVKRQAGCGVRIFLPMFGLLGLDYGWGFDNIPGREDTGNGKGRFNFTIGANLGDL
ncbi:MAG: outer membrane protein assembly factor BamA [Bacteroidetes bacterium]|nr:outer membrane protein assembly factor BamA [Bacteroidota bacterium]MBK9799244.1 outer membrane protein assembly factor BamA [Bacteroidota bacterium]MBP6413485.1 outer membrane protein assembly factor BamA [Bacteroidia bacterium]